MYIDIFVYIIFLYYTFYVVCCSVLQYDAACCSVLLCVENDVQA